MEGPSIVILAEEAAKFVGKKVSKSSGSSKVINIKNLKGQKLKGLRSWGKHFLMEFSEITLKIHFMLFGSYRIDQDREMKPRLALKFASGSMNFYACSIRELEEPLSTLYNWKVDVMSPTWDSKYILKKLRELKGTTLVCDALLNQEIFAGAGNIIKNEVLFRVRLHPLTKLASLSEQELQILALETRLYSLQFYVWKKEYQLRKNWEIYRKKVCKV